LTAESSQCQPLTAELRANNQPLFVGVNYRTLLLFSFEMCVALKSAGCGRHLSAAQLKLNLLTKG